RHAHVADQHPGEVAVDQTQRLPRTGAGPYTEAGEFQPLLHRLTDRRFVVDRDDQIAHASLLLLSVRGFSAAGSVNSKTAPCASLRTARLPPRSRRMP